MPQLVSRPILVQFRCGHSIGFIKATICAENELPTSVVRMMLTSLYLALMLWQRLDAKDSSRPWPLKRDNAHTLWDKQEDLEFQAVHCLTQSSQNALHDWLGSAIV